MKVIAVALLLVAGAFANTITETRETGPPCPLADPYLGEPGDLNVTADPLLKIDVGGTHGATTAVGLSTFSYEYTINLISLTAEFTINVGSLNANTAYTATGYLDARPFSQSCLPSGNFTGAGEAVASVNGVVASGSATIFVNLITNTISLRLLSLDNFVFNSLSVDLGSSYVIGGITIDWDAFNANIKSCVDSELAANKLEIVEKIRVTINGLIDDLTLQDFLDLIGGGGSTCPPM